MRILAVEDETTSRRIIQRMLESWGHDVIVCDNGLAAFEFFSAAKFDVVVSDWMMPEMDGLQLCRKVRDVKRAEYCYFILLTARSRRENLIEGVEAGVDDYLTKPVDSTELRVRLKVAERIIKLTSDVSTLRSLLPICAWCKSVRNDDNLWDSVENYIQGHTTTDLTHAICPICLAKQLSQIDTRESPH